MTSDLSRLKSTRPRWAHIAVRTGYFLALPMLLAACTAGETASVSEIRAMQKSETEFASRQDAARPISLEQMANVPKGSDSVPATEIIRDTALREVAVAYGAQGGLAWRTWEIGTELAGRQGDLDRTFPFSRLAIDTPSGQVRILPPVITNADNTVAVSSDGLSASSTVKSYSIVEDARIVTTTPDWRSYLLRSWRSPDLPNALMRPRDDEERALWRQWVAEGWKQGIRQADLIFEADLARLVRDVSGMSLYRRLVAEGMVDELYLSETDPAITGGDDILKIGERAVRITSRARLNQRHGEWRSYLVRE